MDPEPEPPVDEGDDALVRRAIGGEHDAFATLIERHARTARRLARRVLSDREEVEDVLQEAALAAYLNLRSLKSAERFAGWFCGIVLNHCRMRLRQARRSPDMRPLDTAVPAQPDGGAAVEEQLLLAEVTEAARSLPEAQRDAALLVYFDGLTPAEAAGALGISSSALKVRLHRARNALRSQFGMASSQATRRKAATRRAGMIELEVFDVFLQRRTSKDGREITNAVILLQEKDGSRILPIWIGEAEATALALELQGVQFPRPLTYHFTAALLEAANVKIRSVTMSKLVEDTFFATVEIQRGRTTANIDGRPSDAINIGLRAGAPIFAEEEVLAKASQRFRVTRTERTGSAALVENFEERQRIAKRVLKEEAAEAPQNWRDLGLERLDDGPDR